MMPIPWTPYKYQRKGVRWLIEHPAAALFWDPGLAKSSVTLKAFKVLQQAKAIRKALIVAPLKVCENVWSKEGELGKWQDFNSLKYTFLHGPHKDELIDQNVDLYIINYDGLQWLVNNGHLRMLLKKGVDMLVCDELSKLKHARTKRFRTLKPYLGKFKRRYGLTGSPTSNGMLDLFGQVYVLDLGERLGRYITYYRLQYFTPGGYKGYEWKIQDGAEQRIYKKLKDIALSMRAEDHLDLPQLVEQNLWITLPPKARKVYDDLEEDLFALIDDDAIVASNAAVASGKCRQAASGGVYNSDIKRKALHLHDEKTEVLIDLVDELQGRPLLVAYEFEHDLERIRKALGKDTPAINGSTTSKESSRLIREWNAGRLPVLLGHPKSIAHGLNLQESGNHVCWYSLTWSQEEYDQLNRRVYRQGNKAKRVIIHRILARKTIDEVIVTTIASKTQKQNELLNALKSYRRSKR